MVAWSYDAGSKVGRGSQGSEISAVRWNEDSSAPAISEELIPSNTIVKIFPDSRFVMGYPQKGILSKMP